MHAFAACGLTFFPAPLSAADRTSDSWPASVHARYRLRFNGINVGRLDISSKLAARTYSLSGSGQVSVLFGAIKWSGSANVSGAISSGVPAPEKYAFSWRNNRKSGRINMGFKHRTATKIAVIPTPEIHSDTVLLSPAHKMGALDPVSAILMLTKSDSRPPCDRRVGIFDGKQRYDIVFSYKRTIRMPRTSADTSDAQAYVCRATYEPIAGHRANADTRTYASNRDVEVMLRRIPRSAMLIPYSVTIPTFWGTGSMVAERIEIATESAGKVVLAQ
ncbi:MAG: DUF3108 domain-containing protein [Hyphomicrobiaceae bacterium]